MMKIMALLAAAVRVAFQLLLLTGVHLLAFMLAAQLTGASDRAPPSVAPASAEPQLGTLSENDHGETEPLAARPVNRPNSGQLELLGMVLFVCLLNSTAMITWIVHSTLYGSRQVAATFVVFFTCLTLMPQSETLFFLSDSAGIVRQAATMGLVVCTLWSLAAVAGPRPMEAAAIARRQRPAIET